MCTKTIIKKYIESKIKEKIFESSQVENRIKKYQNMI